MEIVILELYPCWTQFSEQSVSPIVYMPQTPSHRNAPHLGNAPSVSRPISAYTHSRNFDRPSASHQLDHQTPRQQNMPPIEYPQPKRPANMEAMSSNFSLPSPHTGSSARSTNMTPLINREYSSSHNQTTPQIQGRSTASGFRPSLTNGSAGGRTEGGQRMKFIPRS